MLDPAQNPALDPRYDPDKVATASFDLVRRGFNEGQVRQFLRDLSTSLRVAYRTEDSLRASIADLDAKLVSASEVDDRVLTERLGAEAAAILNTAREAAATRLADAQAAAEKLLADSRSEADAALAAANENAEKILATAAEVMDVKTAEADEEAADRLAVADAEVEARREHAEQMIAEAKQEGRVLLIEAQRHREQLLQNLEKRRLRMRGQIERLQAGRDRLLEAYEVVQRSIDAARQDLEVALPEAKIAGDKAARRLEDDLPRSIQALEDELDEARRAGLLGDLDEIAADAAAIGGIEDPTPKHLDGAFPTPADEPELVAEAESEPEAVAEAEPEPEVVAEAEPEEVAEADPERDAESSAPGPAASLFERLRAEHESVDEIEAEPVAVDEAEALLGTDHTELVTARDAAVAELAPVAAKSMKRALSALQNDVLHCHRTDGDRNEVLVTATLAQAFGQPVADAWAAGAVAVGRPGTADDARPDRVMLALDRSVLSPLRTALDDALDESAAVESVRTVCRDARARISDVATAAVEAAFVDGMLDTLPAECPVQWIAGDGPDDAIHAEHNGAAEVRLGDDFPSGVARPEPFTGCRCLVAPLHA